MSRKNSLSEENNKNENNNNENNKNENNNENNNENKNNITPNQIRLNLKFSDLIPSVIKIISKPKRNRTPKDMSDLFEFLNLSGFKNEMRNDLELGKISLQQLFFFSSQFMSLKRFKKNEIIYYENTNGELFYLILEGNVILYKMFQYEKEMNSYEYYFYLKYLMERNLTMDKFILNNLIKLNKEIYPIFKMSDIKNMENIFFNIKLIHLVSNYDQEGILFHLKKYNKTKEEIGFDKVLNKTFSYEEYLQSLKVLINENIQFYLPIFSDKKNKIKLINNLPTNNLSQKNYFGQFKLGDDKNVRDNSAVSNSNKTLLLVINKRLYGNCIFNDDRNVKVKEQDLIYSYSFFKETKKNNYNNVLFYKLDLEILNKGENLYKENEYLNYLYILREGSVEIYLENKNIFHVYDLIKKIKTFEKEFKSKDFDDVLIMNNNMKILQPKLKKIWKNFELFKINKIYSFGLIEYVYNNRNSFFNVKILSDKAKFYKLNINEILENENKIEDLEIIKKNIKNEAKNQIINLIVRLITLKNATIKKFDIEFSFESNKNSEEFYNNFNINEVKNNMNSVNNNKNINLNQKNFQITNLKSTINNSNFNEIFLTYIQNTKKNFHKNNLKINNSFNSEDFSLSQNKKNIHIKTNENALSSSLKKIKKEIANFDYKNFFYQPIQNQIILPKIIKHKNKQNPFSHRKVFSNDFYYEKKNNKKFNNNENSFSFDEIPDNNFTQSINKSQNYLAVQKFYKNFKYKRIKSPFNSNKIKINKKL